MDFKEREKKKKIPPLFLFLTPFQRKIGYSKRRAPSSFLRSSSVERITIKEKRAEKKSKTHRARLRKDLLLSAFPPLFVLLFLSLKSNLKRKETIGSLFSKRENRRKHSPRGRRNNSGHLHIRVVAFDACIYNADRGAPLEKIFLLLKKSQDTNRKICKKKKRHERGKNFGRSSRPIRFSTKNKGQRKRRRREHRHRGREKETTTRRLMAGCVVTHCRNLDQASERRKSDIRGRGRKRRGPRRPRGTLESRSTTKRRETPKSFVRE